MMPHAAAVVDARLDDPGRPDADQYVRACRKNQGREERAEVPHGVPPARSGRPEGTSPGQLRGSDEWLLPRLLFARGLPGRRAPGRAELAGRDPLGRRIVSEAAADRRGDRGVRGPEVPGLVGTQAVLGRALARYRLGGRARPAPPPA